MSSPPLVLPGRFHLVCFDLDGLLIDSEPLWLAAEREVLERRGDTLTPADVEATHGRALTDSALVYGERLGIAPELVVDELVASMRAAYRRGAPAHAGARELIGALRGRVPMAIVSNTATALVEVAIAGLGLDGAFDAIVSGADLGRPKPLPDAYLEACRRFGVAPADAVGFEDSPTGVHAAHVAGLYAVGVPDRDVDLRGAGADLVIGSLADVVTG